MKQATIADVIVFAAVGLMIACTIALAWCALAGADRWHESPAGEVHQ